MARGGARSDDGGSERSGALDSGPDGLRGGSVGTEGGLASTLSTDSLVLGTGRTLSASL